MAEQLSDTTRLCYLDAARVEGPVTNFGGLEVRGRRNHKLGRLDGVIIDPAERQVRYLVVDATKLFRHQRYLLPLAPTQIDPDGRALRVDLDEHDLARVEKFDDRAFPSFSDEDLVTALFAKPHASAA
jgi:hypothetical protein